MSDLKNKYNQLFGGKPKSNDKDLLKEGTYLFGVTTGKKTIKEVDENGAISSAEFGEIQDQLKDIYDQLYSVQEQLDNLTNEALQATGISMYKDMNAQSARYVKAIEQQLENLTNYLTRMEQRAARMDRM